MTRCYSSFLPSMACVALLAASAFAEEKIPSSVGGDESVIQANCDISLYKHEIQTINPPAAIPDNTGASLTVGPITTFDEPNMVIGDVVIDLSATHTWIGDLVVTVQYDEGCNQSIDAEATIIGRPGRAGACTPAGSPFGCSSNLIAANQLLFDDTSATKLGTTAADVCTGTSTTNNPAGCYRPTGSCSSPLAIFENRRKGGCWYLKVTDMGGGDVGTVTAWSVHIFNQTQIGVEPETWSSVKVLYN